MTQNRKWLIAAAATAGALVLGLCVCGIAFALWTRSVQPPVGRTNVEFTGHYVSSFEVSAFTPCVAEPPVEGFFSSDYWLSSTQESGFYARYAEVTGVAQSQQPSGVKVFVHFIGDVSPESKNGYGHLNGYAREVTVTRLLEMSLDGECP